MIISQQIIEYLKKNKSWHFGGQLERILGTFHKPSTVSRTLRELAEEDKIYRDYRKVDRYRVVVYKYKKA